MCRRVYVIVVLWCSIMASLLPESNSKPSSPYLSTTTNRNYHKMVQNFKIFIYEPNNPQFKFETPVESLFYSSLQNSPYVTQNPDEAHLFFIPPFSPDLPTRSLALLLSRLPYWNRTLGADHFFLSCNGIPRHSHRILVELKKNAIQISCFPTRNHNFIIPHKDITLPPVPDPHAPPNCTARALLNDPESSGSKFCLFEYGNDVSCIGEAGCVPVVVVAEGRLMNDMPFMDVMRWGEMAVFVRSSGEVKRVLEGDTWRERVESMRRLGMVASKHFTWNSPPLPFDAFNTVIYQLWLRRHTIRYA